MGKLTQAKIAAHLGMSERNLRELLPKLGMDHKVDDLEDIRIAYINHLRGIASGHQASNGEDLVAVRIREANANADLKEIELAAKVGEFVVIEDVIEVLGELGSKIVQEISSAGDRMIDAIDDKYEIEFDEDLVNGHLESATSRIRSSTEKLIQGLLGISGGDDAGT
jgi:phage terminase Nu1 subunit (DNA packaging protein)